MQRSCRSLSRFLASNRGLYTSSKGSGNDKIVASVLFERLPVVIPKIDPVVYGFQEYSLVISVFRCAESALESVIGDLSHTYFVGNAPMGYIAMPPAEKNKDTPSFKVRDLN
ncbi:hypothetical protein LXL04_027831 [Taraxacum kok-saghyz]